jgi:8-oxo-dGTP pyrophosphatase MutT (NUDIX family)
MIGVVARIRSALMRPLPGLAAQMEMAPRPRSFEPPSSPVPRQAAVLALLYPLKGALHLALTVRTSELGYHRGQVSLAGGGLEAMDASLEAAALREAEEEIGVDASIVEVLGALTPLYVPPSNNCIHPFVGYVPERPDFVLDRSEVAELVEVPLDVLLDPATRNEEEWVRGGKSYWVPFFAVKGHQVWGATAMILAELIAVIGQFS